MCTQAPWQGGPVGKADQLILADGVPLSRWVALVDADRDGEITEVNTTARQDCSRLRFHTAVLQAEIQQFLANADTNHDGQLDEEELVSALQREFPTDYRKAAREMMKLADTDGDGVVSLAELRAVFVKPRS